MAVRLSEDVHRRVELSLGEATGALGDSITVLPVVVALGALTPASLPHVLLAFGVFQVVWGLRYGLPLSVEPMKALAGLAIAGAISYAELVAAGLVAGAVLLAAGRLGVVGRLQHFVGEPVVRGIQLAVALLLGQAGLSLALGDPVLAGLAVVLAAVAYGLGGLGATAPVAVGVGLALALAGGLPSPTLPSLSVFPTGGPALTGAALEGTVAQLAMTVGNAAVATAVLCDDLFGVDVSADDLAESMGAMCLGALPFGGLPMCHGSGGLAGKHTFGARTGGANLVLGGLYLLAVPFAAVVAAFPMAVLGVLLVLVAAQLGRTALSGDRRGLAVGVGALGFAWNVGAAFVVGAVALAAIDRLDPEFGR